MKFLCLQSTQPVCHKYLTKGEVGGNCQVKDRKRAANYCNLTAVGVLGLIGPASGSIQLPDTKRKSWRGWPDSNRRPADRDAAPGTAFHNPRK